jgi:hypothetical protein
MRGTYGKDTINLSGDRFNVSREPFNGHEHRLNGPAGLLFGYGGRKSSRNEAMSGQLATLQSALNVFCTT